MPRVLATTLLLICCASAGAEVPGEVKLSSGKSLTGKIRFRTEKLRLQRKGQRAILIPWQAISAVQVLIWREKALYEAGKSGPNRPTAPALEFRTRIVLRNGSCLWGTLSTQFTFVPKTGSRRSFGLTSHQRGKLGQTRKDLLHVVELRLGPLPAVLPCQIALRTDQIDEIQSVRVLGLSSQHVRRLMRGKDGVYRADRLWPDRYDMLVVTPKAVYLNLSGETPTMPMDVLTYQRRRSLGRWLASRAGKGVKRRALTLAGRVRRSRVLVQEETRKAGKLVERRLDIYQVEYRNGRWTVRFIVPIYRDTSVDSAVPLRWLHIRNELTIDLSQKQPEKNVLLRAKLPEKR